MNREIPKSAYDALASQRAAAEHPSGDLLNGYVEQSLSPAEKAGVTQHLAACEDCREVVFLAHGAIPETSAATVAHPAPDWERWKSVPAVVLLALASSILVEHSGWFAKHPAATCIAHNNAPAPPAPSIGNQVAINSNASAPPFSPAPRATPNRRDRLAANAGSLNKKSPGHTSSLNDTVAASSNQDREALAMVINPASKSAPPPSAAGWRRVKS